MTLRRWPRPDRTADLYRRVVTGRDIGGQPVKTRQHIATIWAEWSEITAPDVLTSSAPVVPQGAETGRDARAVIRYRADLAVGDLLSIDGVAYAVWGIAELPGAHRRRWQRLSLHELLDLRLAPPAERTAAAGFSAGAPGLYARGVRGSAGPGDTQARMDARESSLTASASTDTMTRSAAGALAAGAPLSSSAATAEVPTAWGMATLWAGGTALEASAGVDTIERSAASSSSAGAAAVSAAAESVPPGDADVAAHIAAAAAELGARAGILVVTAEALAELAAGAPALAATAATERSTRSAGAALAAGAPGLLVSADVIPLTWNVAAAFAAGSPSLFARETSGGIDSAAAALAAGVPALAATADAEVDRVAARLLAAAAAMRVLAQAEGDFAADLRGGLPGLAVVVTADPLTWNVSAGLSAGSPAMAATAAARPIGDADVSAHLRAGVPGLAAAAAEAITDALLTRQGLPLALRRGGVLILRRDAPTPVDGIALRGRDDRVGLRGGGLLQRRGE